jgi:hypothetical protein
MYIAQSKYSKYGHYWQVNEISPDEYTGAIVSGLPEVLAIRAKMEKARDIEARKNLKKQLPALFAQYEVYNKSAKVREKDFAGFGVWHVIDIDKKDNAALEFSFAQLQNKLFENKDVLIAWKSPSGGLKALVKTIQPISKAHWQQIQHRLNNRTESQLNLIVDRHSEKNTNEKCFLTHDSRALVRGECSLEVDGDLWTFDATQGATGAKKSKVGIARQVGNWLDRIKSKMEEKHAALELKRNSEKSNLRIVIISDFKLRIIHNTKEGKRHDNINHWGNLFGGLVRSGEVSLENAYYMSGVVDRYNPGEKRTWLESVNNAMGENGYCAHYKWRTNTKPKADKTYRLVALQAVKDAGIIQKTFTNGQIKDLGLSPKCLGLSTRKKIDGKTTRMHAIVQENEFKSVVRAGIDFKKERERMQYAHTQTDESEAGNECNAIIAQIAVNKQIESTKPPNSVFDLAAYVRAVLGVSNEYIIT